METLVLVIHYAACTLLIISILLQAGKGADIGAVFGGASQTLFGSRGPATFLNKFTIIVASIFLVTSISLAQFAKTSASKSVITDDVTTEQTTQPATDAGGAVPTDGTKAAAPVDEKATK